MLRERSELLAQIHSRKELLVIFQQWTKEQQNEFLDFCCGERGVKILYDSVFKEIMNPEYAPERLNELLSLLLGFPVKILTVLPNDSTRIADESSLLVTDIIVELKDGSLANVEVQKIGYLFPGQRSACYSADLLLRQYKRIRDEKKKTFHYKDIKTVYTIVLFEQSPKEFKEYPEDYLHFFQQQSDTGLELELLQKYLFVPLDIFKKCIHNKPINNKLEAWLYFLSATESDDIIRLVTDYPEFHVLYEEIYQLCLNTEKVMSMFSKELQELDRNTVQYMIDEMQDTINAQGNTISEQQSTISELGDTLHERENTINEQENTINELGSTLHEQENTINEQENTINEQENTIREMEQKYQEALEEIKKLKGK